MKKIIVSGVLTLGLMTAITGCGQGAANNSQAMTDANAPNVIEEPAEKSIQAFGVVTANDVVGISVNVPTAIEKINVNEGQKVKQGDVLVELDLAETESLIKQKEDELKVAKLQLEKIIAQSDKQSNSLQQQELYDLEQKLKTETAKVSEGDYADLQKQIYLVQQNEEDLQELKDDLPNKKALLDQGAISKHDYEEYEKSIKQKENELQNNRLTLDSLKSAKQEALDNLDNQVASKKNAVKNENLDITISKQNIKSLEDELKTLRDKLKSSGIEDNKIICNKKNGVVSKLNKVSGDKIKSEDSIMTILDLDSLVVKANIAEDFIKDVQVGNEVVISPLADMSRQYNGVVRRKAALAVESNGETVVPLEIEINDIDEFLLPNFNVNLKILTGDSKQVVEEEIKDKTREENTADKEENGVKDIAEAEDTTEEK